MLSEKNYYDSVNSPLETVDTTAKLKTSGVIFYNCTGYQHTGSDTVDAIPYSYTLDPTANVPAIVMAGAGNVGEDVTPPTPNPMTWQTQPYATSTSSIAMVATTATDVSGVEYYFACTLGGGHDSGWQSGTNYTDTGLAPNTTYAYRVLAHDLSSNHNETGWSTEASAKTLLASPITILQDGFEVNFDLWTDGGTTDWDRATDQKKTGTYSAHAGSADNDLISDNLNTAGYAVIKIEFWYMDDDIDNNDDIYLQLYNGSVYDNKFELGNSPEDVWNFCEVTLYNSGTDAQYFRSDFRIKFEGTSIDKGENLWIDDVKITVQ